MIVSPVLSKGIDGVPSPLRHRDGKLQRPLGDCCECVRVLIVESFVLFRHVLFMFRPFKDQVSVFVNGIFTLVLKGTICFVSVLLHL